MLSVDEQLKLISAGVDKLTPLDDLKQKLASKRPLVCKLGVDPTSPDLHLGHAVVLRKLKQLQELGHQIVLIIGSGTSMVGDPSGRNSLRPQLTKAEIAVNAKTYQEQAFKVLDKSKTKVVDNADWLTKLDFASILDLMGKFTLARIIERDDFANRLKAGTPVSLHELLYPVCQAYDSVQIKADIELGGSDQLFNLLAGRELMEKLGMEPQVALTMPLLEGTDGVQKMSKSYGNYIGLTDEPSDMYGKVMSIPDTLLERYLTLATDYSPDKVSGYMQQIKDGTLNPKHLKELIAQNIVSTYYDAAAAQSAKDNFDTVFTKNELPDDIPLHKSKIDTTDGQADLLALLIEVGFAPSKSEARRQIDGGGVKLDGEAVPAGKYAVSADIFAGTGPILQFGKRKFVQIILI